MAIYSDIDIGLMEQRDGDITIDTDVQAVFNSLRNITLTLQGSRRMRPDFAYGPSYYLFEAINDANAQTLGSLIYNAILQFETRVNITNVHVTYDAPHNLYNVTISFAMVGSTPQVYNVTYILKRL